MLFICKYYHIMDIRQSIIIYTLQGNIFIALSGITYCIQILYHDVIRYLKYKYSTV